MIVDRLEWWEQYAEISTRLRSGLSYLAGLDTSAYNEKTVEIDGLEHEEVVCRLSVIG